MVEDGERNFLARKGIKATGNQRIEFRSLGFDRLRDESFVKLA